MFNDSPRIKGLHAFLFAHFLSFLSYYSNVLRNGRVKFLSYMLALGALVFSYQADSYALDCYTTGGQPYARLTSPARYVSEISGMYQLSSFFVSTLETRLISSGCLQNLWVQYVVEGGPYRQKIEYRSGDVFYYTLDTSQLAPGEYRISVVYRGTIYPALSVSGGDSHTVMVVRDETGPEIFLPGIVDNSDLSGVGTVRIEASDASGIQDVQILLGDTEVGFVDGEGKRNIDTSVTIDSSTVRDGDYKLIARATDTAGNVSEYKLNVRVNNVDDKPVVSITSPTNGSEVSGSVRIRTNTTDDNGIRSLKCYISGVLLSTDTTSPYDCLIQTTSFDDGPYQIAFIAEDTSGQSSTTFLSLIFKNSQNDAPTIDLLSPVQGQTLKGTTKFLVSAADDLAVAKVEYYLGNYRAGTATLSPFSLDFNTRNLADGIYQLTAIAYDYEGLTKSDTAIISIRNGDYTEPGVFISSPEDGAIVSGTIELTAVAVDNVAVKEVRYYLNGEILGVRSSSPYKFTFEAATAPDGDNTITAVAIDYTGNQGSHEIHITIDSFAPPTTPEDPDTGEGIEVGTGTTAGTETGTDEGDEDLNNTVANLAENLNNLVSTVNTLTENQSQLEEQVAAIQAMLTQLLEIFGSSEQSEALKANPRRGQRLTRKANRQVLRLLKATSKRAFKIRRKKARRAMRRLSKFLNI